MDETEAWKEVGRRLQLARGSESKRAVARRADISEGWWRALERGERSPAPGVTVVMNVRDETLAAAAKAVGLDPKPLFELVGRTYSGEREPEKLTMELLADRLTQLERLVGELVDVVQAQQRQDRLQDDGTGEPDK